MNTKQEIIKRDYYSDSIANFLNSTTEEILGKLVLSSDFSLEQTQRSAWLAEIKIMRKILSTYHGAIYFEYSIPRMGRRIDIVLLIGPVIFVLEFKVGEREFTAYATDQVWDYALDLKNFHESSHDKFIAPVLIATDADKADNLTMTASNLPSVFRLEDCRQLVLSNTKRIDCTLKGTRPKSGTYSLSVSVSDGKAVTQKTLQLIIFRRNWDI